VYLELDSTLAESNENVRALVHAYAKDVARPAARKLDRVPADSVAAHPVFRDAIRRAYEIGLHTVLLPETFGGLGLDPTGIHVVLEELGWGSASFAVSLGVAAFPAFGCTLLASENQKLTDRFVTPFTADRAGELIGCWGITEPDHGTDWILGTDLPSSAKVSPGLTARRDGDDWILDGQKSAWVSNGPIATHCYLFVGLDRSLGMRGSGVALVDLRTPGVSRGKAWDKHGQRALPQGEIFFDQVRIPGPCMVVADPETYAFAVDATLSLANSAMGAIFTGVARAAYEEALRYAGERIQGGVPIRQHQAVQLKLSQMWQRVEVARAISRRVMAHNYATITPSLRHAVAAKVFCTEAAYRNADDAIQLFGGMGLGRESDIEMIFRDARCSLVEDGVNDSLSLGVGIKLAAEDA
jgi:alkylation response protein AidB-like acyl-CoA dehydrogenase